MSDIIGADGKSPVYNPNGRWQMWNINEIYLGDTGSNKFIPKINDLVFDIEKNCIYIVEEVGRSTYIPKLKPFSLLIGNSNKSENDKLINLSNNASLDTLRVFLNKSVVPYTADIDRRVLIPGKGNLTAKLFLGTDISENGKVISKTYVNNGSYISENIESTLVSHSNNSCLRYLNQFNISEDLTNGEIVSLVIYDDNGAIIYTRRLCIEICSFVRPLNAKQKYIVDIGIESIFISTTANKLIELPVNVPIESLNLTGVISYSDGSQIKLPVDGSKFSIEGLDNFASMNQGQEINIKLLYKLDNNESSYTSIVSNNCIVEDYKLRSTSINNSYNITLFAYPEWVSKEFGYKMKFFLSNVDRTILIDVSDKVIFNKNTGAFDPKGYGIKQTRSVSLNLKDVSESFKPYIHVQYLEIVLESEPIDNISPWTVRNLQSDNEYGKNLFVKKRGIGLVDISCGISELSQWLQKLYINSNPIINSKDNSLPSPTHFVLMYNNVEREYEINNWDSELNLGNVDLYKNIYIKFIKRDSTGDMKLSVAGLIIY